MAGDSAKIIHVDMDAVYVSVAQRDDPQLRGKPVIVAWRGNRSVVCAASYEARRFGLRSAMPAVRAERLCPGGIFVPPDFTCYRAVSRSVREIFKRHTDVIEPLALDEAYFDINQNMSGLPTATLVARAIREQIRQELQLTASAGVAPTNCWRNLPPSGANLTGFLSSSPRTSTRFFYGYRLGACLESAKSQERSKAKLGIQSVRDLRRLDFPALEHHFGRYGRRLHDLARGIDDGQVVPDRPTQSISVADTLAQDVLLAENEPVIRRLAERLWSASRKESRTARTVVLMMKTCDFKVLTRSHTPGSPPSSWVESTDIALRLRERVALDAPQRYRLVGVGLSNFREPDQDSGQPALFA